MRAGAAEPGAGQQSRAGSLGAHSPGRAGDPAGSPTAARPALLPSTRRGSLPAPRHPARPAGPHGRPEEDKAARETRGAATRGGAGSAGLATAQSAARSRAGSSGKERRSRGSAAPALGLWARGAQGRQERRALPRPGGLAALQPNPAVLRKGVGRGNERFPAAELPSSPAKLD